MTKSIKALFVNYNTIFDALLISDLIKSDVEINLALELSARQACQAVSPTMRLGIVSCVGFVLYEHEFLQHFHLCLVVSKCSSIVCCLLLR